MAWTRERAKEVDLALADLWGKFWRFEAEMLRCSSYLERSAVPSFLADQYRARIAELEPKMADLRAEIGRYDDEYRDSGRWPRFFLVVGSNGHVHSSRSCETCYARTRYAWLPDLSGAPESEAVEIYGEKMCTICFPSAPSAYAEMKRNGLLSARERNREAKIAERAEEKKAKAILDVDGKILKCGNGWAINSVASAKIRLTDHVADLAREFPNAAYRADLEAGKVRIARALAAKLGTTEEAEIRDAEVRARKRR